MVEAAQIHHPDAVLLDIDLPGPNGLEATRRIKETLPRVAVVMLSRIDAADWLVLKASLRGLLATALTIQNFFKLLSIFVAITTGAAKGGGLVQMSFLALLDIERYRALFTLLGVSVGVV